jgi:hypothetical protein
MNWVDRLNGYFLNVLLKRRSETAQPSKKLSVLVTSQVGELTRLALASSDEFVGETLILYGVLTDGTIVTINETEPDWANIRESLDKSGRLKEPFRTFELKLLADSERQILTLIDDSFAAVQLESLIRFRRGN